MNNETVTKYLLTLPEATLDHPFGPVAAVFRIQNKMFALLGSTKWHNKENVGRLNLKCDPIEALGLRDIFTAVIPGYHMNKKHWNSIMLDKSIPKGEIERMIDRSYALVVKGLTNTERRRLEMIHGEQALYR